MSETSDSEARVRAGQYDANYGNFKTDLYEQIRREAFGEDIGQNSWLTVGEQDEYLSRLNLSSDKTLLDVACGAGGPALRIVAMTGCSLVGIDVHEEAIRTARALAVERGLGGRAAFCVVHAGRRLPFPDATFDAITCIDAVNHLPDRPGVVADWARLLKPGGRLLFTDPTVVTAPLTNNEIALRSSAGFYLFVPPGYDEGIIVQSGLRLLVSENRTRNMADVAERRMAARAARSSAVRGIEGDRTYEAQQEFFATAALIAKEGRLSRFSYVAEKTFDAPALSNATA